MKYSVLFLAILAFSCQTEKKAPVEAVLQTDEVMDSIDVKVTYQPLSSNEIATNFQKVAKDKISFNLPQSSLSDSSVFSDCIEELAIVSTYLSWAETFKITTLQKEALERIPEISNKAKELNKPLEVQRFSTVDSLVYSLDSIFEGNENYKAYFEAIKWLENLKLTLDLHKSVNKTNDYHRLIEKQLHKGDELLNYLYEFQDYTPISSFSLSILELIDCRNYQLDVVQLNEMVLELKKSLFFPMDN